MTDWITAAADLTERVANSPLGRGLRTYFDLLGAGAEVFARLQPLARDGWTLSTYGTLATVEAHAEAARIAADDPSAAAQRLEDGWGNAEARGQICSIIPYVYPAEHRRVALRRSELLERASMRFSEGLYEEVVLLVYSQLDGMFLDIGRARGDNAFARLFMKTKARSDGERVSRQIRDLVRGTDAMIGTQEDFFLAVREGMTVDVRETTLEDHPSRHGILHGRVLGYGTRRRAAQSFAFLAGCVELLVITAGDELGLTEEEEDMPVDELPPGALFILGAQLATPVRAVYVHHFGGDKDLLVAEPVADPPTV